MFKRAHISFDDVFLTLRWLYLHRPCSIYDMRFWGTLKRLHEEYGAIFSLYTFLRGRDFDLNMLPSTYCQEFYEASSWLRFGFHSETPDSNILHIDKAAFTQVFAFFFGAMGAMTPTNRICSCLRLHNWAASEEHISVMKQWGIQSLLCRNTPPSSYILTQQETDRMIDIGRIEKNGMQYIRTDIQYDNCTSIDDDLARLIASGQDEITLFGHEQAFGECVSRIEQSIRVLCKNGYRFFAT